MRKNKKVGGGMSRRALLRQIYILQIRNSKKRGHPQPKYSLESFIEAGLEDVSFNYLYQEWARSGYDPELRPSCDRILDNYGYSFENIQWLTYRENLSKPKQLQQTRVIALDAHNSPIAIFFGIRNAGILTGHSIDTINKYIESGEKLGGMKFAILSDDWKNIDKE